MDGVIAKNPSAYRDYSIAETIEAGLELKGSEVKSLRANKVNLKDSFARVERGEVFLYNMHIASYEHTSLFRPDPIRTRKLLLHRAQIDKLIGNLSQKGMTLVPLKLYFKKGLAKIALGVAKGRRLYDKREAIKKREIQRDIRRTLIK